MTWDCGHYLPLISQRDFGWQRRYATGHGLPTKFLAKWFGFTFSHSFAA
jgi:hypothetical protein